MNDLIRSVLSIIVLCIIVQRAEAAASYCDDPKREIRFRLGRTKKFCFFMYPTELSHNPPEKIFNKTGENKYVIDILKMRRVCKEKSASLLRINLERESHADAKHEIDALMSGEEQMTFPMDCAFTDGPVIACDRGKLPDDYEGYFNYSNGTQLGMPRDWEFTHQELTLFIRVLCQQKRGKGPGDDDVYDDDDVTTMGTGGNKPTNNEFGLLAIVALIASAF